MNNKSPKRINQELADKYQLLADHHSYKHQDAANHKFAKRYLPKKDLVTVDVAEQVSRDTLNDYMFQQKKTAVIDEENDGMLMSNCCSGLVSGDTCLTCMEKCQPVNWEKMEIEARAMVAEQEERISQASKY